MRVDAGVYISNALLVVEQNELWVNWYLTLMSLG